MRWQNRKKWFDKVVEAKAIQQFWAKMEISREHFRAMILYGLNLLLGSRHHARRQFITGSNANAEALRTSTVKEVLAPLPPLPPLPPLKTSMMYAKWSKQTSMWPTVRFRHAWVLAWHQYIQFCTNVWVLENCARDGSHTIWLKLKKKGTCRLVQGYA